MDNILWILLLWQITGFTFWLWASSKIQCSNDRQYCVMPAFCAFVLTGFKLMFVLWLISIPGWFFIIAMLMMIDFIVSQMVLFVATGLTMFM